MKSAKIEKFMQLGGQLVARALIEGTPEQRKLGARLLLSEVLEYVIHGLGVEPEINGVRIADPDSVDYRPVNQPNRREMVGGLADVAYTMYWNACAFGVPLEEAFELVCDNNLDKFVKLEENGRRRTELKPSEWHCDRNITWPKDVVKVEVVKVGSEFFAVGKDGSGKVRKPSSYAAVDLSPLVTERPI